jgi:hypothetical protein
MNSAGRSRYRQKVSLRKDHRGFTLAEAIVGGAVAAICCLMLASGFGAAVSMIRKGNDIGIKGEAAFSVIEGANPEDFDFVRSSTHEGYLSYRIGEIQYGIPGIYKTAFDDASDVIFIAFTAEDE